MRENIRVVGKRLHEATVQVAQSFLSVLLIILFSKWAYKPIRRAKGTHCLILGNGPSLQTQLEEIWKLRAESSVLSLNDLPFSTLFVELRPDYHVLVDPYYWFLSHGRIPERTERLFRSLREKVTWPISVLLPYEMEGLVKSEFGLLTNSQITITYFNRTPVAGLKWFRFKMYDWQLGMPIAQNVLVAGIYLMLRAKYKEIVIFGADHSWHENIQVTNDNILRVREPHFKYNKDNSSISDREEYFDPIYKFSFDKSGKQEIFKVHDIFAAWSRVFEAYWALRDYADYLNVKVINKSRKSYIDAFDRN